MKISYKWLQSYIDLPESPEEVAELLTQCGLEVESVDVFETIKGGLKGVVSAEVVSCEKHPNADKLSLTRINAGGERLLDVVCGAPNVAAGQKVLLATIGTVLNFGDKTLEIKAANIRGARSEGMICAEDELGLGTSHDGILVLPADTAVGIPAAQIFNIETDYVFEIGLTPNRSDATSHIGVARDLIAVINADKNEKRKLKIPLIEGFSQDNNDFPVEIVIKDEKACPRYTGISFSDITVAESPEWLKNRLTAIGLRPINNVVDITNFVLMECGQPLHAFDLDCVKGRKVVVKKAEKEQMFTTLDGEQRRLSSEDLMICNSEESMCIAGVFGGISSGVSQSTRRIFLESAFFNSVSIRKTSRYHNLKTDASFRFERGADPEITIYALKRAAQLLSEICNAKVSSAIVDIYPYPVKPVEVFLRFERLKLLIGKVIPENIVQQILTDLGFVVLEVSPQGLLLRVPTSKVDVTREVDVIEEVLRIYGYNKIDLSSQMLSHIGLPPHPQYELNRTIASGFLADSGYLETMNVSLGSSALNKKYFPHTASSLVYLLNPLSRDLDSMRQSLLFNALENVSHNLNRKQSDIKLFEFGKVYQKKAEDGSIPEKYNERWMLSIILSGRRFPESWENPGGKANIFDLKTIIGKLLWRFGIDLSECRNEEIEKGIFTYGGKLLYKRKAIAEFGLIGNDLLKEFDIRQEVFMALIDWETICDFLEENVFVFKELPKYPEVRRDLALVIDKHQSFEAIQAEIMKAGGNLVRDISLFDVYEGEKISEGKKSYAVSVILGSKDKTLTDKDIDSAMNRIVQSLSKETGAVLR